jgi:DNA repair protein RadC
MPSNHNITAAAAKFIAARIGLSDNEKFIAVFLNTKHRVIACETMSEGTIDHAAIHAREVVKRALAHNAAAIIFAHNHVAGDTTPSAHDIAVTRRLRDALSTVNVRLLDHFIVSGTEVTSLAVRGQI